MNIPKFKFKIVDYNEEVELATDVLYNAISTDSTICKSMYDKYPVLYNYKIIKESSYDEIYSFCENNFKEYYNINMNELIYKMNAFQDEWNMHNKYLLKTLSNEFNIDWNIPYITIKIGNVALCPRWLKEKAFYVPTYYDNFSEIALHECCHFIYFEKCKQIFNITDESIFEYPNLEWILSEALIEPILGNEKYEDIINKKIKSYDIFYQIIIDDKNYVENLKEIFNQNYTIEKKLKNCFDLSLKNQDELGKYLDKM